jgi:ABC-2 type transport system permease protein
VRRIASLAVKETRQFLRDRLTLSIAALLPVVLMGLYGTALNFEVRNLPLAVTDEDNTALSRAYLEAWAAAGQFEFVDGEGMRAEELFARWKARAVLVIPAGFERDWKRSRGVEVQLVVDGTDSNTALLLRNIGAAIGQSFGPAGMAPPVALRVRHWYNPGLSDSLFFGSGALGLVLILFPSLLGAIAVSRELELGTVAQAYASRLTAAEWVLGKAAPYFVVGLVQLGICYGMGMIVFDYRLPEHVMPLAAACVLYLLAAVFFGMMAGNLTGTQSAAIQTVQLGAFLLSLLLSGFLMPLDNIPAGIRWVSMLVPARHFIEVTREVMLRGGGWETSLEPLGMLAVLALLFLGVNLRRMRKMQFEG